MKKTLALLGAALLLSGCTTASHDWYKSQMWTPDSFNYTLQRDRNSGDMSDYFGLSWGFK